jgi:uncharacterized protein (DUF58 family)
MIESTTQNWFSKLLRFAPAAKTKRESDLVFPPDFLGSLERLRLVALKAMGGGLREGHRLGAYKGGQLEFHGHRSYSPGDELRYVDWNSYARLGKPFVKEFAREEAGVLHLLLDDTASMSLGEPSKWTFARRVCALFSHVATSSKDVAYVYVFRNGAELEQFPKRGAKGGIQACLSFLEKSELSKTAVAGTADSAVQNGDALNAAVSAFLRRSPQRGRVMIISDFWQEEREIVSAAARLSSAGFDISAIHVLAREELTPEGEGELLARSVEDDGEVELSAGSDLLERYGCELELHQRSIEETFRKRGGNYLLADSSTSIERVLITTLRQRRFVM